MSKESMKSVDGASATANVTNLHRLYDEIAVLRVEVKDLKKKLTKAEAALREIQSICRDVHPYVVFNRTNTYFKKKADAAEWIQARK